MPWIFLCITVVVVAISLIVSRRALALDAKREIMKRQDGKLLEEEKKRLQEQYKKKENSLAATQEDKLKQIENDRQREFYNLGEEKRNLENAQKHFYLEVQKYKEAYNNIYQQVVSSVSEPIKMEEDKRKAFISFLCSERGRKALEEEMSFSEISQIEGVVHSSSGKTYKTSLEQCECDDQQKRGVVCKHMLSLAVQIGALNVNQKDILDEYGEDLTQVWQAEEKLKSTKQEIKEAEKDLEKLQKKLELLRQEKKNFEKWKNDVTVSFPWISETLVWIEKKYDDLLIDALPGNAYKSEDIVKMAKKEKKELAKRISELETQIAIFGYFSLERFRNMPIEEFNAIVDSFNKLDIEDTLQK